MRNPSGEQHLLETRSSRAVVTEVGAGLRVLELGGEGVVLSFAETELCGDGRGQLLAPWPNRLEDGSYVFGETSASAPLNEPARHNAIHGLYRFLPFVATSKSATEVVLETSAPPQPGYPWWLTFTARYRLGADGLGLTLSARNESATAAPFGVGFHPYLLCAGLADGAGIELDASSHLLLDERGLPRASEPFAAFAHSEALHGAAPLGSAALDDCFTGLGLGASGRWRVGFRPLVGAARHLVVEADAAFTHVMIYSADHLAGGELRRAVAIEPMTCAPNALHSGEGVIRLDPGATFSASLSIALDR